MPARLMAWREVALPRPRPLAAAAFLSVAALLLATANTANVDAPTGDASVIVRAPVPEVAPPYIQSHFVLSSYTPPVDATPLVWNTGPGPVLIAGYDRGHGRMYPGR
jgi:hypothetical protein